MFNILNVIEVSAAGIALILSAILMGRMIYDSAKSVFQNDYEFEEEDSV